VKPSLIGNSDRGIVLSIVSNGVALGMALNPQGCLVGPSPSLLELICESTPAPSIPGFTQKIKIDLVGGKDVESTQKTASLH